MIPDQAEQPVALHGNHARRRRRGHPVAVWIERRRRLAHAHPLVGALHVEDLVGVRPRGGPHRRWRVEGDVILRRGERRRRRVEGGVVLRRGRGRRRVEIVGEGVGREGRRRAEGEVGRGADRAELVAGGEPPWMVHGGGGGGGGRMGLGI